MIFLRCVRDHATECRFCHGMYCSGLYICQLPVEVCCPTASVGFGAEGVGPITPCMGDEGVLGRGERTLDDGGAGIGV